MKKRIEVQSVEKEAPPKEQKGQPKEIWGKVSKISIYLLVFLLPLFFLPWTTSVLAFNKQALLVLLVFLSLLGWFLESLTKGKVNLNFNVFNLPVIAFLTILGIATLFSSYKYGSFWGWPLSIGSSFLTILGFVLFYLLIVNIFQKKSEILGLLLVLAVSSFLAIILGILQLFGKFVFPFDFSQLASFNTIGTVNSLGLFGAVLLPLVISLTFITKKLVRSLLIAFGLLILSLVLLVGFWAAWLPLLVGIIVILLFGINRRQTFQTGWLIPLMVLLAVAMFFGVFRVSIPGLPATPLEVSPSCLVQALQPLSTTIPDLSQRQ